MKLYKIIKYNLFIFILLLVLIEFISYIKVFYDNRIVIQNFYKEAKDIGYKPYLTYYKTIYPTYNERIKLFKPVSYGKDKTKRPIALFGCSFTWGSFLKDNETFSAVLSNYTGRTVYNRGLYATGIPFFYYQLKQNFTKKDLNNPEYIIYTLIDDHFFRLLTIRGWCKDPVLQYMYVLNKNGELKLSEPKFPFIHSLFSSYIINKSIQNYKYKKEQYKDIFLKLMREINEIIKEKYPETKFVILVYQDKSWKYEKTKIDLLKQLENEEIEIIYTDDLTGKDILKQETYLSKDKFHPSSEAWQLIVPSLSKKLNL